MTLFNAKQGSAVDVRLDGATVRVDEHSLFGDPYWSVYA